MNIRVFQYNRRSAVEYAHKWALGRNPAYYDFNDLGGDCTNFASQVVFTGSRVMNYTPVYGWYYINANNRTPSWTGAMYFYDFLVNNDGPGPFGEETDISGIAEGDVIQLSFEGDGIFNHTPVVVSTGTPPKLDNILVAAHTYDRDNYPITNYSWAAIRFIHIKGVRG
jgi:hypothetical protein